jgi:predicted transcriptional regulator
MTKTKMLSFRLDAGLLRKIDILCIARHRSRGQVIREALEMYFRAHIRSTSLTITVDATDELETKL